VNRVDEIVMEIAKLRQELLDIQEACSHPPLCRTYKYGSNTGNYDPSCDSYWIDHACNLCGKHWQTDQERENRAPAGAKEVK
jgi:hypothetical protein